MINGKVKKGLQWGAGVGTIPIGLLLWNLHATAVETKTKVEVQETVIAELKKLPERVKGLEIEMKNLDGNFIDFRTEQRKANKAILSAIAR